MAVADDHIFHLASGTELSVEAARGDLSRVREFLVEVEETWPDSITGIIGDLDHVGELITQLAQGYHTTVQGWQIVQLTALVHDDEAHELHRFYADMTQHDESRGAVVETRDLTAADLNDFSQYIEDASDDDRA